ncbi:MAG: hypothetical protein P4L41_11830 [Flavipsychrobacter sp.]|nr:hypothetical protein [Flavipsychrobacter sp.]
MGPKINIEPDCGNSPRKQFLKELYTAFANADVEVINEIIPQDISWIIVGNKKVQGLAHYVTELKRQPSWKVKELTIDTIITHGPEASASGQIITADDKKFSFCDVYKFKRAGGTTISTITTFMIKSENK